MTGFVIATTTTQKALRRFVLCKVLEKKILLYKVVVKILYTGTYSRFALCFDRTWLQILAVFGTTSELIVFCLARPVFHYLHPCLA